MKKIPLLVIVSALIFSAGVSFGADRKKKASEPAAKPAPCCAKAWAEGRDCPRSCCQEAAAKGRNCKKCGGVGMIADNGK